MLNKIKEMFGFGPKVDLGALIKEGALIVDVRTKGEYASGHVKGSINIPLDQLNQKIGKLDNRKTIITCCASGMRSSAAKRMLKSAGFPNVHNGGSWNRVSAFTKK